MIRRLELAAAGFAVVMLSVTTSDACPAQQKAPLSLQQARWQPARPGDFQKPNVATPPSDTDSRLPGASEAESSSPVPSETAVQSEVLPADPDTSSTGFDLEDLIAIAHSNSPALQKFSAVVDEAEGLRFQATRRPNPTFGYQAQEVGNDGELGQHGIFWAQTWIRGNKLALAGDAANWEKERRGWEFQVERYRIASRVRKRYYTLLSARRVAVMSQQILAIAELNVKTVEELFDSGEIARNEVLQGKIELQQAELRRDNSEISLARAERLLAIALSTPSMDCSAVNGNILATVPELTVQDVQAWLENESPELEVAKAEIARTKSVIARETAKPISNINTQLGVMFDDSTNNTVGNFQVSWQIPKRDANNGNIQAAEADSRRAQHAMAELRLNLESRVQAAFGQYELSRQKVRSYEKRVLPLARENLKITRESYKLGEASYQTLLTAQRSYFDSALALVEARRLLWLSVARVQGLVIPE